MKKEKEIACRYVSELLPKDSKGQLPRKTIGSVQVLFWKN
jgi:hypothetical protein